MIRRDFTGSSRSILAGFLLLTGGVLSMAQDREYICDHFNVTNGLISDMVYKIVEDSEGHAWIVTYNGLQKYNGYEFETYTANPEKSGTLSSNFVDNMFEDRNGDMIVVLEDGIDIYNKHTDRFYNLLAEVPFGDIRRDEISRRFSAVQDRNGSIWVNCNNQVIRIDSSRKDIVIKQDDFHGRFVLNLDSTLLWIITDQTLKKYDLEKSLLTITNIEDIPTPRQIRRLNTIYYDTKGFCWIGTSNGLFLFDEVNFRFLDPSNAIQGINTTLDKALHQDITAIYEDYQSDLWIASGKQLRRISRKSGYTQDLQHELDNPNSILDEQITGIHGNQNGVVWVTYMNEGFTRIIIRTSDFLSYRFRPNQTQSLGGKSVRSVFKDDQGYIWIGLYNDGLDRVHPVSGEISHFKYLPGNRKGICSNYIASILLDRQQRLWVGSHDNGLCYTDDAYKKDPEFRIPGFLDAHEEIYHIQEDSLGRIWLGTRFGLGLYDYRSDSFQWVLTDHNVQSFIIDHQTIWIASWNAGLCKLAFSEEQFGSAKPVFDSLRSIYLASSESGLEDQRTRYQNSGGLQNCISIYLDNEKTIWLGSFDRGLVRAIETGDEISFKTFDVDDGAPGNAVYGVSGDRNGNIWISTQHGLGKFDPSTERFDNYYRQDGLLSNYFMWKSYFKAPDGKLYFGSVDGLNVFQPELVSHNKENPRIIIAELRIDNVEVESGDTVHGDRVLDKHITFQDTLVLNYWNRDFSLRYYATGQLNPRSLRYEYMLEGYNDDWIINESDSRTASYTNLPPATYHFRVRTTEPIETQDVPYEEKVIIIMPPWWKTTLAWSIYLLLIVGLMLLIIVTLVRFLGLKQELVYNEKFHQSKLMFFTNISHEFKTPLSLIKAPLEDILSDTKLSPHNRKYLHLAKENADNLLNLVNELLEFRRTDTGNSKLRSEPIELNGFIGEIAAQFECIAEQNGVHFYHQIPADHMNIWVDRQKFKRIVNNLLENALKYTGEEGLVTLSVVTDPLNFKFKPNLHTLQVNHARKNLDYVGILVSDTGLGISRDSLPRIFDRFFQIEAEQASQHIGSGIGLALVKNLVLMHYGEIHVASERGVGTEILVLLPIGNEHLSSDERLTNLVDIATPLQVTNEDQRSEALPSRVLNGSPDVKGKPSILLVEDHENLRQFLKEHLAEEYHLFESANGREGLKILSEHKPDLIIADWIMPVMDGAAFIKEVRSNANTAAIPIILLTAKDELKDRQEGLDLGADQVIPKPFNVQLLRSQIHRTIENNKIRLRKFSLENMENLVQVKENRDVNFIEEVERIIRGHIRDTNLNAGVIARELGISRTSLYDRIRSITGQTMGEYVQQIRLKHAIKLMLFENISVSEVYVMVGFSSSSYFIRLFRKYYQTTPKEYIKNYLRTASN